MPLTYKNQYGWGSSELGIISHLTRPMSLHERRLARRPSRNRISCILY